jgi:hypothetical protein
MLMPAPERAGHGRSCRVAGAVCPECGASPGLRCRRRHWGRRGSASCASTFRCAILRGLATDLRAITRRAICFEALIIPQHAIAEMLEWVAGAPRRARSGDRRGPWRRGSPATRTSRPNESASRLRLAKAPAGDFRSWSRRHLEADPAGADERDRPPPRAGRRALMSECGPSLRVSSALSGCRCSSLRSVRPAAIIGIEVGQRPSVAGIAPRGI